MIFCKLFLIFFPKYYFVAFWTREKIYSTVKVNALANDAGYFVCKHFGAEAAPDAISRVWLLARANPIDC
jgi:hypothetical protein